MDITNENKENLGSIFACFGNLKDPRVVGRTDHNLLEIIVVSVCAIISGARCWTEIRAFGLEKYTWLKKFLTLKNGIPSHQTLSRVFSLIPAEQFQACFIAWMEQVSERTKGEVVAIDGKSLRRSHARHKGQRAIHMVNAFATANGLALGHCEVPEKSNEIKGIPKLLKVLELQGCIVTMDAMGTQKGIAKLIRLRGADYVLALKANHGRLHKKVKNLFEQADKRQYENMMYQDEQTFDYGHGRIETRTYRVLPLMYLQYFVKRDWQDLQTFIEVTREREELNGEHTIKKHYYISSLPLKEAKAACGAIRLHWHVENRLHWNLDVTFREDECRIRRGFAARNFATLRQFVLNSLRQENSYKGSLQSKILKAAWNTNYLAKVVGF